MNLLPCPLCGYETAEGACPHCALRSTEASLGRPPEGAIGGILDGLRAVPMGFTLLLKTRGVKRFLVPPVLLTLMAFTIAFVVTFGWVDTLLTAAIEPVATGAANIDTGWLRRAVEWVFKKGIVAWLAKMSGFLAYIVVMSVVAFYVFSLVYEAVAGPFLDEVHGRIEKKWFGKNPRDEMERPTALPVSKCVMWSLVGAAPASVFVILFLVFSGPLAWMALLLAPVPYVILGFLLPDYGTWLRWVVKVEGRTLYISVKATILAAILMVPAMVLKLIPIIGIFLFGMVAGFATALTLLDIPFSRRQWPLQKRVQFLLHHFAPMVAFGFVSSLVFIVPVVGPIVLVPSASVGGLWLVCRLDKNPLRPKSKRFDRAVRLMEAPAKSA